MAEKVEIDQPLFILLIKSISRGYYVAISQKPFNVFKEGINLYLHKIKA
jgi:hypothetical protein